MPAAGDLPPAPGAGHGDEGDASFQGPAQEQALPVQPKPADADAAVCEDELSSVIALRAQTSKSDAAGATARAVDGLVTVRPKPEKRKNARERAKEKYANKATTADGTTPDTTAKAKSKVAKKAAAKVKRKEAKAKRAKRKRATA